MGTRSEKRIKPYLNRRLDKLEPIMRIKEVAKQKGICVYLVGGSIRDMLMGKIPQDIDIAVQGEGEDFASNLGYTFALKKTLDEYRVIYKGYNIDVLGLGEKSIEEDLKRRDFAINSMAMDIVANNFYDPFNGIKDIEEGIIRMVSEKNIQDDPVRILRGIRLASALNFSIEKETLEKFIKNSKLIKKSAPERIHQELVIFFSLPKIADYLYPDIFSEIFPGFNELKRIPQGKKQIVDVLEHSILTVKKIEETVKHHRDTPFKQYWRKISPYIKKNMHLIKIAGLLHDIGKSTTMKVYKGKIHFYGHEDAGVELFMQYGKTLKFSKEEIHFITRLIKNHMWLHLLAKQPDFTERSKRRIIFKLGEDIIGLALISWADALASNDEDTDIDKVIKALFEYYYASKNKIKQIIMGRDLIKYLHLEPGETFGKIIAQVQAAYEEGDIKTKSEAIKLAKKIAKGEENGNQGIS